MQPLPPHLRARPSTSAQQQPSRPEGMTASPVVSPRTSGSSLSSSSTVPLPPSASAAAHRPASVTSSSTTPSPSVGPLPLPPRQLNSARSLSSAGGVGIGDFLSVDGTSSLRRATSLRRPFTSSNDYDDEEVCCPVCFHSPSFVPFSRVPVLLFVCVLVG